MNSFAFSVLDARVVRPRFHGLDTLRSLAILAVLVFHLLDFGGDNTLPAWLEPIAAYGWMGVDLFFVLSGYLIGPKLWCPGRDSNSYPFGHGPEPCASANSAAWACRRTK